MKLSYTVAMQREESHMIIEVRNLVKRYKDVIALDHFNMQVVEGEI